MEMVTGPPVRGYRAVLSLNHQITTFLSGHPDWPPGD
jgi:hypothetical protein